ncbi:MAG: hypothetical protein CVU79_10440 [Elusimicrobia bacterium HGW-Elusimicrobia-3]|nr:MAG: hypothetical protein CVU79_10440 [Elusimicrobia bacterium HGW-Elusimicrobia-3]
MDSRHYRDRNPATAGLCCDPFSASSRRRQPHLQPAALILAAELELEDSERTLKTGVLSAQADIALQVKTRQLLEFQVKALRATTDNLLSEYSLGGASSLQLDSSQTKYLDSSNNQITALNDLDLALANYKVLMGEKIWE